MKDKALYRRALGFAIPMMIQNGITNAVNLVDNVMVGSLGTEAMTGVSIIGQLIFVFNLAIFGGLSGPGIYGAQFYGQGSKENFRASVRMKAWICLVCLLGGLLAFRLFDDPLIHLYLHGESADINKELTIQYAKQYLSVMLIGLPPFVITQIYAGSLRETGKSVLPMIAGIVSVATDIVFNYLLIYGKFGFPMLGVRGAAIATVIARYIECAVLLLWTHCTISKHPFLQGVWSTFKLPKELVLKMLRKSLPIFFNEFLWAAGLAAMTQCYGIRGLEIVAGMNISNVICNLMNVVFVALGNAVGILSGQTLGAAKPEQAKSDAFKLMWFTGFVTAGISVILIAVSEFFPRFYDTSEQVRTYAANFIRINALFFPVQGFLNALYFTLRSGGKTLITFLFDSVYSWTIIVPTAFLICNFTAIPIYGVYTIILSFDIIKVIIGYILIQKGVWISNLAKEISEI